MVRRTPARCRTVDPAGGGARRACCPVSPGRIRHRPRRARCAGAQLTTFPRAPWWSVETATTVGSGDPVSRDLWGRFVAVVVMVAGIEDRDRRPRRHYGQVATCPSSRAGSVRRH
ncbi:potassium channel family protein [Streptomyces tendae]|uniref:potassium channel family protein n=1 Tax=Streptomyces tendae TaxID=1932 RepID=UPI0027E3BCA5|nr:potassium channel family protein [Streptomyces tendae]